MGSEDSVDLGIEGVTGAVRVGQGSYGTVYRATQVAYGRTVAVKVLAAPLVDEPSRKAFDRECLALGTISDHPGIVTLYAAGISAGDRPYLIMEFLSGGSLADALAAGPMPWQQAITIGIKIAGALATAHAAGVLHRDIKPENVLLDAYNEPELADFGVAKVQGGTHTSMGMITGSIAYAAPEVLSGVAATETSDVWALASTIATLMAGVSPFHRDGEQSLHPLLMRIITAEPNDLRPFGVPDDVRQVITAALAKDTWERTPTAVAFGEGLQQLQQARGLPVTTMTVRQSSDLAVTPVAGPGPSTSGPPPVPAPAVGPQAPAPDDHVDTPEPVTATVTPAGEESATIRRAAPVPAALATPVPTAPPPAPAGRRWGRKAKAPTAARPVPTAPVAAPVQPVTPAPVAPRPAVPSPAAPIRAASPQPTGIESSAPPRPAVAGQADPPRPPPARPGPAIGPPKRRGLWLAAGIVAVAVAGLLFFVLFGRSKPHRVRTTSPVTAAATTIGANHGTAPATPATTAPPIRPVFADDFTNPASGWAPDLNQAGAGTAAYKPDGYHVVALKAMPALNTFSAASPFQPRLPSISVSVAATLTGVPADGEGVRCDQGARLHLRYTFEIHGDGSWVVFKIDDNGSAALLQGQSPNVINAGTRANLITGTCTEVGVGATKLTMLVNGVTLGTVTDPHPGQLTWHAGLVVYRTTNLATDVRFNSFQTFAAAK